MEDSIMDSEILHGGGT